MENKDVYRRKIEALLKEWEDKVDVLIIQADAATVSARSHYDEQLQALQAKQEVARQKLHELKGESGEAWEEIKEGLEEAWDSAMRSLPGRAFFGKRDYTPLVHCEVVALRHCVNTIISYCLLNRSLVIKVVTNGIVYSCCWEIGICLEDVLNRVACLVEASDMLD